jgi:ribosome-binding protein aMBF1 (putative translation factor)
MEKDETDNSFKGYLDAKLKNKTIREAYEHYHDILKIGLQIRDLRESAGLTQKLLSQRLGVTQQVIARLESGEADNPTATTLKSIAEATGYRLCFKFEPLKCKSPIGRGAVRGVRSTLAAKARQG